MVLDYSFLCSVEKLIGTNSQKYFLKSPVVHVCVLFGEKYKQQPSVLYQIIYDIHSVKNAVLTPLLF